MKKIRKIIAILVCLIVAVLILYLAPAGYRIPAHTEPALIGKLLGPISLLPPVFAVIMAFLTADVVISLLLGVVSGIAMLVILGGSVNNLLDFILTSFTSTVSLVVETCSNPDYATVLILCLVVGGLVSIIRSSNGFDSLASWINPRINSVRKANYFNQLLGAMIFFDDYANALIVGPLMRPITDKLKISREKLAFIVDSTAAPVVSISLISSWVAVEVSVINQGLEEAGIAGSGYNLFLRSIPYCFYCLLAIVFVFLNSTTQRDFGPMLKAELRARSDKDAKQNYDLYHGEKGIDKISKLPCDAENLGKVPVKNIIIVVIPILVFIISALISFYLNGRNNAIANGLLSTKAALDFNSIVVALENADTIFLVLVAASWASFIALVLGKTFRFFSITEGVKIWIDGASSMLITVIVLVLAWSLASIISQLGTVSYIVQLVSLNVGWWLVPSLLFLACMLTSYAAEVLELCLLPCRWPFP